MNINEESTVAVIATNYPNTIKIFEKYGIDYCCGGIQPLGVACNNANVAISTVVEEIKNLKAEPSTDGIDLRFLTPSALIDYIIKKHHEYTTSEMGELEYLLEKVCNVHENEHPELRKLKELFKKEKGDLTKHLKREELQVFPFIKYLEKVSKGLESTPIQRYQSFLEVWDTVGNEHQETGKSLEDIKKLTNNFSTPSDACTSYKITYKKLEIFVRDLHQHIHLENNVLRPMGEELFNIVYGQ